MRDPLPRLHAITDERVARRAELEARTRELARGVEQAGHGGGLAVHARGRALSGAEHYRLALRLSVGAVVRLFVNDRLDVALVTGAAGVQLAQDGLDPGDARRLDPDWWIGKSVHDIREAEAAREAGADYLLVGAVYATPTHAARAPIGPTRLATIVQLGLPVLAIGGVTPERVPELRAAGAYGVAAIGALWNAVDPAGAARRMMEELAR